MTTPLIIMVGADKGGVGKTTLARVLDDYVRTKGAARKVFDTQLPNGDLKRFAPAAHLIDIDNVDDQMRAFDTVEGVTLVDLCAGRLSPTLATLNDVGMFDDVRKGTLAMALVHVIGPSVASLGEIAETAAAIGGGVRHFLVKNFINEGGFAEWEKDERFAALLRNAEAHTITVPHLPARVADAVQHAGVSFEAFAANAEHKRMLTGYVRKWLSMCWTEFGRVGLGAMIDKASG
jgi:hypothetical protein